MFFENSTKCVESPVECNLYAYAGNNPINYVDPEGLDDSKFRSGELGLRNADVAFSTASDYVDAAGRSLYSNCDVVGYGGYMLIAGANAAVGVMSIPDDFLFKLDSTGALQITAMMTTLGATRWGFQPW